MRKFLWLEFFKVSEHFYDKYLLIYSLKIIILVFIICVVIDFIRQIIFKYTVDKFMEKYFDDYILYVQKKIEKLKKKVFSGKLEK